MSSYENYSQTSRCYDATRVPVGVEIIAGCLAQSATPLGEQRLLDAGCGTGSYAAALCARVGCVSAVDLNQAMLERAREKLAGDGRVTLHRAAIDALPFADAVFDGVMVNQVLHHLDPADGYSACRRAFSEFARVLKPGGALVVNTCSRKQLRDGFWYYALIPDATARMIERHPPLKTLRRLMTDAGIAYQQCFVPVDAVMQGDAYFNPRGPLDAAWRDGDSIWSTVADAAVAEACAKIKKLDHAGELENFTRRHDAARKHIGQFSFLYGRRKS